MRRPGGRYAKLIFPCAACASASNGGGVVAHLPRAAVRKLTASSSSQAGLARA